MFVVGFLVFGPQLLIGMSAAELSHKKAAATSNGFVSCISYLGAAAAGYPLGTLTLFGVGKVFYHPCHLLRRLYGFITSSLVSKIQSGIY